MKDSSQSCGVLLFQRNDTEEMKWENKGLCSTFFFFLGHLFVEKNLSPFLVWKVWKDSENKCVSFGSNFPFCKLQREGSQRVWDERGLLLGLTENCEKDLASSF